MLIVVCWVCFYRYCDVWSVGRLVGVWFVGFGKWVFRRKEREKGGRGMERGERKEVERVEGS